MESLSDEVTFVDSGNIKILNDYCLIHIFEYLTVDDKLNAEEGKSLKTHYSLIRKFSFLKLCMFFVISF